eukprot:s899_g17.t3
MMHPEGAWQLRAMIANAGLASLRPRRCTSDGASASAAMRSARRHMGWLPASFIGIAFVAACWHAGGERLFLSASQKTGSLRAPPTHGVRAEDIKVVRSSSMNYLALCATALSAAVLVRRSPPKSRPRVRIQACQTCATPSMQAKACTTLPISIDSMDFLGSGACFEALRQGLPVREQLHLRATCATTKACLSDTSVFWDEVFASRASRGAKRGVLAQWLDYKRWYHRAVTQSRALRLRRLFAALRGPVLPQQFLDAVRARQRQAAQRCLKELRAQRAIRQDAVRRARL